VSPLEPRHVEHQLPLREEVRAFQESRQFLAEVTQTEARRRMREQVLLDEPLPRGLPQDTGNSREIFE
jgi:hypothetical protein